MTWGIAVDIATLIILAVFTPLIMRRIDNVKAEIKAGIEEV